MVFATEIIERSHNGNEHRYRKIFQTLEAASEYLQRSIEAYCADFEYPENWDADDMGGASPPSKLMVVTARLQQALATEKQKPKWQQQWPVRIYGPESEFGYNRPYEILIEELELAG